MPRPKLLEKRGKVVEHWKRAPEAMERLRQEAPRQLPAFRLRPLPRLPRAELLILPERLPQSFYLKPFPWFCRIICPPRYRVRKNQKNLTPIEWARFVHAIEALAEPGGPSPSYGAFVDIHHQAMTTPTGMTWGAHSMGPPPMDGRNFVSWHREYLAKIEAALIAINPLVTIPYWDWVDDRAIPPQLSDPADLAEWGITRGVSFNGAALPTASDIAFVMTATGYATFHARLEGPHGMVHNLVGGTMMTSRSPADPLFWLHHGFIDKLWADWEAGHPPPASTPPNASEALQPPPIMTRTVAQVVATRDLGYVYA